MKGEIGFGEKKDRRVDPEAAGAKSFAHLEDSQIDARVTCELRDHPLFLFPSDERRRLFNDTIDPLAKKHNFVLSDYIKFGDLCHKCKAIFEALLSAYHGDYLRVLQHVQVERFYPSRRYRKGIVSVEPQMAVDAGLRQITVDRSFGSLPTALQMTTLFEAHGELVDANRGILEFNDLLKRPLESYKYLLATSEKSTVALPECTLFLDVVLIATSNEKHLAAFKEFPDFPSFKGRLELVKVPYILQPCIERQIYDEQASREGIGRHITPHATRIASLWAVLTRLKRPMTDRYQQPIREILASLRPLEKARLYDNAEIPDRFSTQQAKDLRANITNLWSESYPYPHYEGRSGASPREIKTVLLNASQSASYKCVHPMAVFEELRLLVRQPSVYEFLNQEVVDGYHDNEKFIEVAWEEYLDWADLDVRAAMGLVDETRTEGLFERYVMQISHWLKKEKVRNRLTSAMEDPDESLMNEIEEVLLSSGENKANFRAAVISQIAAYSIDHPKEKVHYGQLFPKNISRLNEAYYEKQKKAIRKHAESFLKFVSDSTAELAAAELTQAAAMLAAVKARGYCESCARDTVTTLLRHRYTTE
jgi:predicted Ser/Thr protein kinase